MVLGLPHQKHWQPLGSEVRHAAATLGRYGVQPNAAAGCGALKRTVGPFFGGRSANGVYMFRNKWVHIEFVSPLFFPEKRGFLKVSPCYLFFSKDHMYIYVKKKKNKKIPKTIPGKKQVVFSLILLQVVAGILRYRLVHVSDIDKPLFATKTVSYQQVVSKK